MDLDQKTTIAKKALDSVIDHDDAPLEEVKARFESIATYATARMTAAAARRHEKAQAAVDGSKLQPVAMTMSENAVLTTRDVGTAKDLGL